MSKRSTPRIGTWPTPDKPATIEIPGDLLKEFGKDARIVCKHPWLIGIPVPDRMLKPEILRKFTDFEVMLVPKQCLK